MHRQGFRGRVVPSEGQGTRARITRGGLTGQGIRTRGGDRGGYNGLGTQTRGTRGGRGSRNDQVIRSQQPNPRPENVESPVQEAEVEQQAPVAEKNNNQVERVNKPRARAVRCWLPCKVNGQSVVGLCAPGCTHTYMTHKFMEKLNLSHLLNQNITGFAEGPGLGKQTIVGQLANIPVELSEEVTITCSFYIIENDDYDAFYFGIDTCFKIGFLSPLVFNKRMLRFHRNGKDVDIPFLIYEDEVPPVALSVAISALITCEVEVE